MNVANGLIIYYTSKILLVNNIVPIPAYYYALLVVTFLMQSVSSCFLPLILYKLIYN